MPEDISTEWKHVSIKRTHSNKGYTKTVAWTAFIVTSITQATGC
jgi:hypothetical protein